MAEPHRPLCSTCKQSLVVNHDRTALNHLAAAGGIDHAADADHRPETHEAAC